MSLLPNFDVRDGEIPSAKFWTPRLTLSLKYKREHKTSKSSYLVVHAPTI